jgi:hypothetical protein
MFQADTKTASKDHCNGTPNQMSTPNTAETRFGRQGRGTRLNAGASNNGATNPSHLARTKPPEPSRQPLARHPPVKPPSRTGAHQTGTGTWVYLCFFLTAFLAA